MKWKAQKSRKWVGNERHKSQTINKSLWNMESFDHCHQQAERDAIYIRVQKYRGNESLSTE